MNQPLRNPNAIDAREVLAAVLFYLLIAWLYFFPQLPTISTALIGPPEDNMQQFWYLWHGTEALLRHDRPLLQTTLIYYPGGISLYYISYFYASLPVAALLQNAMSYVAIYNLCVMAPFVLGGLGTYGFARALGADRVSSLAGGFLFAFNPHHVTRSLHHVHIANTFFIPFFMFFVFRAFQKRGGVDIFLAAFFLLIGALSDWAYLVYGMVFLILACGYRAFRRRQLWRGRDILVCASILACVVGPLLPLILPMIRLGATQKFVIAYQGHDLYVSDFLGFFIPGPMHLLGGIDWIRSINARMTGTDWEKTAYLGLVNLLVIAAAFPRLEKEKQKYLGGLAVFAVLAMGSSFHFLGKTLFRPMPYWLLEKTPFLTNARNPNRILEFAYFFLAVLAVFSLNKLFFSKDALFAKRRWVGAVVLLMLFLDFYSPCRAHTPVSLPAAYQPILKDFSADFGILEIPYDGARYQMYQTIHGIPIVQGYVNRRFESTLSDRLDFNASDLSGQKKTLEAAKVKYILIFKRRIEWDSSKSYDRSYEKIVRLIIARYAAFYPKIHEDAEAALFRVYS